MFQQPSEPPRDINSTKTFTFDRKQHWRWNLRVVISNLYMKTELRLPGACVPSCLNNTDQCVRMHRCAALPDGPSFEYAQALRNTLHGQHYDTFLEIVEMKILRGVFPGDGILERLADMALILTAKGISIENLISLYKSLLRVFYLCLNAFPPCWTGLRPCYLNFLGVQEISSESKTRSTSSPGKLELYLDLLEKIMPECSDSDISEMTKFYQKHEYNFTEEDNLDLSQETVFLRHVQSHKWMSDELCLDDFHRMNASVCLARVFDVLNMFTRVLEMEFLSWLDHNRLRQTGEEIFDANFQPFAVLVFNLKPADFFTDAVRQVMNLFSLGAAKSLYLERLNILQRLIALIIEVSNTAELQYLNNAVIYPYLGPSTQQLITNFFKIFKTHNAKNISTFLKIIPQLDQPYLRFEFADQFLRLFHYSKTQPFGPQKVCKEFQFKQWLNYKPKAEITDDKDVEKQLSQEDYLNILLNALKDYCQWFDLATFWNYLKTKESVQPLQTIFTGPLATSVKKEQSDMNTKLIASRPKVNLPIAKVHIDVMSNRYGNSIVQLRVLRSLLRDEVSPLLDVTAWLTFLDDFFN